MEPKPYDQNLWLRNLQRMLSVAEIKESHLVLYPCPGSGETLSYLPNQTNVWVVEENKSIHKELQRKYPNAAYMCADFTKQFHLISGPNQEYFDRIIITQPFAASQSVYTINHAYNFLKPGGILTAIVPNEVFASSGMDCVSFRLFLDQPNTVVVELEPFDAPADLKLRAIKIVKP